MLETLPIVRFGEREEEQQQRTKPTDVELAEGELSTGENDDTSRNDSTTRTAGQEAGSPTVTGGIAAATTTNRPSSTSPAPESEGCSICTDDFILGQDQRVLPCNHRFHPECIDPWLLNVSGTCPLCRIDLRPAGSGDDEDELDADGNPVSREGEDSLAPPLDGGNRRASVRRSILVGLTGYTHVRRPERMTREERVEALREYSRRHRRRRADAERRPNAVEEVVEQEEEERGMRRRLRNAFRVRTRRTGEVEEGVDGSGSAAMGSAVAADPTTSSTTVEGTNTVRPT
jgi:hypothetical protein